MKNRIKLFLILIMTVISAFYCCGCQSTDKGESYFNYSEFEQATFEFNEETNETKVVFNSTLTNETIFKFNSFSLTLNLYEESAIVETKEYNYKLVVKQGDSYTGLFTFTYEGKIDSIEFVSWQAKYLSLWETYRIWFIVSIILVCIAVIIYIVLMVIEDLELSDTFEVIVDFFEEHGWVAIFLLIPLGGGIWSVFSSYWVPVVIVLGALLSFILICLFAHLVKHLIQERGMLVENDTNSDNEEYFDNQSENVDDYVDDVNKLIYFTKEQLKEYCQLNGISGYSKLNKADLVDLIVSKSTKKTGQKNEVVKHIDNKKENAKEELDSLIGLESVKNQLKRIRAFLLKNKNSGEELNLHMCFYGNPGTGKTVVARLMANIFHEVGVLPTNKLIETDRSGLCGQYVGQTAPLTHKKVKEAMGGVLFIDEAYTLCADSSGEDYGKEAIAALLKDMEDYKGKFCVILAGYKEEMEKMIALNPGFDSRINRKIDFPNYTITEQMQIFNMMLEKKRYEITEEAKAKLLEIFEIKSKERHFANARTVRNILEGLVEIQALRTMEDDDLENDDERIIRIEDVEQFCKEN